MKKIFVVTGEPSGDKLASTVISKLKKSNPDIEYLCVGGTHLNSLGIKSIFDLKEITYIGFTSVLLNIFKILFVSVWSVGYPTFNCSDFLFIYFILFYFYL